jgi:3-hydroxyacyl-CoA dehydrogenase
MCVINENKILVIGVGTIGNGIAQSAYEVLFYDTNRNCAQPCSANHQKRLEEF